MVVERFFWLYLLIYLWACPLLGQEVHVEASVDQYEGSAGQPIQGTVSITHPQDQKIDQNSFKMSEKPITVRLEKEISLSQSLSISIYRFTLPAQDAGLYVLPAISATIGQKIYQSTPSSYQIKGGKNAPAATVPRQSTAASTSAYRRPSRRQAAANTRTNPFLSLQAFVQGPSQLYPGQRTKLMYRITYNRSIDLTYSNLPFVHIKDFQKIGDERVEDYENQKTTPPTTYQDITQEVEAFKTGTFQFGPAVIEGYAYQEGELGEKIYYPHKLHAEAPVVTVTVAPFPQNQQPASFNGALGKIQGQAALLSNSPFSLGEPLRIELKVRGITNLATFKLPSITCQPGFSGFFYLSDLPPAGYVEQDTKRFLVELNPISSFAKAIPSIELSSFDPDTKTYQRWQSQPIPIDLQARTTLDIPQAQQWTKLDTRALEILWQQANEQVKPLDIPSFPLKAADLFLPFWQTWALLLLLPLGALLLVIQIQMKKQWLLYQQRRTPTHSQQLLRQALKEEDPTKIFKGLKEALLLRLQEYKAPLKDPIKHFIEQLELAQYGPRLDFDLDEMKSRALHLFKSI